jgi:hypothetical protein
MEFYRETPRFCEGRRRKLLENTSRTSNKILVGIHSSGQGCAGVHLAESGLRFNSIGKHSSGLPALPLDIIRP